MTTERLAAAAAVLCVCPVLVLAGTGPTGIDSFEESPDTWRAVGGSVSVSDAHWKLGRRSLKWGFSPGSRLIRGRDAAFDASLRSRAGGVKLWLYCEQPIAGTLRCRAGPRAFPIHLGFTGWRAVWVLYSEDAQKAIAVNGLEMTAPNVAGTLYLDAVELGDVPWFRQGDAQAPYTNPQRADGKYWTTSHDWSRVEAPAPPAEVSRAERDAFRTIQDRHERWMFGGNGSLPTAGSQTSWRSDAACCPPCATGKHRLPVRVPGMGPERTVKHALDGGTHARGPVRKRREAIDAYIRAGHKAFEKLGLQRRGDVVHGPGAFSGQDRHRPHLAADVFQHIALPLAYDARLNGSEPARRRFVDLVDYAHDQGWAAGSLMGSGYGGQLRIAGYVHAVYILRDHLRAHGRLERELDTLRYHLNMGETYRVPDHPGADADDLRTRLLFRLLHVLMLDDSPEKVRDMRCLVRWANSALSIAPGYADTIKPDGTVFHHATAYASAYGNNAMHLSSLVYWLLADTEFALERQAGENVKRALLALRFMAGQYHFPMGVSGRWPFSGAAMVATSPALAYMADALDDRELGGAFARLWRPASPDFERLFGWCAARIYWANSPGSLPWLLDAAKRYEPEGHPQGHRAYPYAAMSFHRRRQWVASVRGWSRYVWNYEASASQNRYGRYSSYGMLQVFSRGDPANPADSGYREHGWDWRRPPGATVIRVPIEDLHTSKVLPRQRTNDPFVGGVALEGRHGVWAMRFADPHYEKSFRFRKSAFFVDETLLCLGSGISNADSVHPTETVLYQTALTELTSTFPYRETCRTPWLVDPVGNGYYFPEPQAVELRRWRQKSMDSSARRKTEGDFAVAWIDHGPAPTDAAYAYAIRPDTTPEAMKRYAAAPDFEVLRRDATAHIVRFPEKGITGYVLFAKIDGLGAGVLGGVDTPCLVMIRRDGDRAILAVCDPDLRLPAPTPQTRARPGAPGRLRLRLDEGWRVEGGSEAVHASGARMIEVTCRDGANYQVTLQKK